MQNRGTEGIAVPVFTFALLLRWQAIRRVSDDGRHRTLHKVVAIMPRNRVVPKTEVHRQSKYYVE